MEMHSLSQLHTYEAKLSSSLLFESSVDQSVFGQLYSSTVKDAKQTWVVCTEVNLDISKKMNFI